MKTFQHSPVLLEESVRELRLEPGLRVLDGTLGGGGHAARFFLEILPDGWLYACDLDQDALAAGGAKLAEVSPGSWTLLLPSARSDAVASSDLFFTFSMNEAFAPRRDRYCF